MTRQRRAQWVTAAVVALLALALVVRERGLPGGGRLLALRQEKPEPTPQNALYAMLDAARQGDVSGYLSAFSGPLEASLRQSAAEQGTSAFARYLRETNAPIKGIAITEPQTLAAGEVKVRVEYVYQDRNEAQFFYLERQGRDWKVVRLDAAERVPTLIPYGTPVQ